MPAPAPVTIFGVCFPSASALFAALGLRTKYSAAEIHRRYGSLEALALRRLGTDDPTRAAAALQALKEAHGGPAAAVAPMPSALALLTRVAARGILSHADHAAALRGAAGALGVTPPPADLTRAEAALGAFSQTLDLASIDAALGEGAAP